MSTEALTNVINRLDHMKRYWEEANSDYFKPDRFLIALQGCITTSRTVTFILQSNKASFPDFEKWYATYQEKWSQDPIMAWARDARNAIEKRGDLETLSQVKSRIVASYMGGPETEWLSQDLFSSPIAMLLKVPSKFRNIPQVREHGTLVIERRWIDKQLPETEVLEALTHVYLEFVDLLTDLHHRLGVELPRMLADRVPLSMRPLIMDRAIYISIKDGSEAGFRFHYKEQEVDTRALRKRYGRDANWEKLSSVGNFKELCDVVFAQARILMLRDGYHHSFAIMVSKLRLWRVIGIDHPDRASRYVLMRDLAELAKVIDADGIIVIGEAWTARGKDVPPSGYAVDAQNRGEALTMHAAEAAGQTYSYNAAIIRKKKKKHKVKALGPTEQRQDGFQFIMAPFQIAWGCLDHEKLKKAEDDIDRIMAKLPEEAAE
ncbi:MULTISPECIES: hypothetical protein [unclassified Agrobacterium]|uniref:hypothetical protein n=1 Tax=unclassified Agrobacterium TaxID=2632611 RepID=UPI002449C47B|nr:MULTISPECIES: hypothetical protein [unclassified Agrobacterium]MDH0612814.1 hypothetical protein [Agrobacterium sp. GD03872]MDH0694678.1 hypothetical protein [Agrobacterium sp. GD03871]MDH1057924.1 hypothetical protein [Agrobacterium sp. GD03992]MDH2209213.1 hypothetical protein [Agrobacterium sp. GD03643]MDH2218704.1 hypothetical protein [Agrobacterium sp. GD03638]